jgi:hypothetical protein
MASPDDDALVKPVVLAVSAFLDAVLRDDVPAITAGLTEQSLQRVGLAVFGTGALGVALGLAAQPHQVGLTSVEAGDGVAVAEVRGQNEVGDDVSASTVMLAHEAGAWKVDDIWPVPADCEFDPDLILEPTVLFYNGQAQLPIASGAVLDAVEAVLVPGLQRAGLGLQMLVQGVALWRAFRGGGAVPGDAALWAAVTHLAVLAVAAVDPNPQQVAEAYGVPMEDVAAGFGQLASRLGFGGEAEQAPPPPASSGLVDLSGRPLLPSGSQAARGGIILPGR